MRLRPEQLHNHLQQGIASVYLLSGDEPQQLLEYSDAIRHSARQHGYDERQVMEATGGFDWNSLAAEAASMSLFAQRRILELRIPSGKPGREGAAAISDYLQTPPEDTLLLIILPKLEKSQQSSKWFKSIDQSGVVIQVWPLKVAELPGWIQNRAQHHGLQLSRESIQFLAQQTEGNLIATNQEIEKLRITHGVGNITLDDVAASASGSAHFSVFELIEAALSGETARALKMIRTLRAEGTHAAIVLWAMAREVRLAASVAEALSRREPPAAVFSRQKPPVWKSRQQQLISGARRLPLQGWYGVMNRLARADEAIKSSADPWILMEEILLEMRGA
ncbi:MAG: DNA polymerase III subunit delta [Pseudomonadota bacterium]